VIQGRVLEQIQQTAPRAVLGGRASKNHPLEADMDHGPGTHRARLLGHIELAFIESPVIHHALRLSNSQHLGMRGGILESLNLVESAGNNPALMGHHGPDGDLLGVGCPEGLANGFAHKILVAMKVNDLFHVRNRLRCDEIKINGLPLSKRELEPFIMNIIAKIEQEQMKKEVSDFKVGDAVRVHTIVKEGDKERVQIFAGIVIGRKGTGINQNFTVRRISYGEGVERVFPIHSPRISKVEVESAGTARRAKLNYLRGRKGKQAMAVRE